MGQKKIWMPYLIIGISVLLLTGFSGCFERVEYIKTVNYIYKNQTGVDLVMEVYNSDNEMFKEFNILNGRELETNTTSTEGGPAVFSFSNSRDDQGDSVIVRFIDNNCILYLKNVPDKIFIIEEYDNYSEELMEESKYTLYFTFTEDDYNSSLECN